MARAGFLLLAGALLAAGIYSAVLRGWADANYTTARLALDTGKGKATPAALAAARAGIDEALLFEPSNPHFVEQSALLHDRQALALERGDPEARRLLERSLGEFRTAAQMRPGSPYVWAGIVTLKLRLRELDDEFYGALARAAQLGPWEPQVQLAIADTGLAAWRRLAPPARAEVIGAIERGLLRDGPAIRRIAAAHDALLSVCTTPSLPPRVAVLCVKM